MTVTIIFALAAALANAVHLMTQHTASVGVSNQHRNWALVAFLIRQPLWLLGWAAAAGGFAFQAIALHAGQLSVVQALLVTELVFALVLRRFWVRQHIAKTAWIAALVTCGALAVFLTAAEPHGGHLQPDASDWVIALVVFGGAVATLAIAARWGSPVRPRRALCHRRLHLVGLDGCLHQRGHQHAGGIGRHRHAGALAALRIDCHCDRRFGAPTGRLAGRPVERVQPLIVVVDPAVAIVLSVWIFDERFTASLAQRIVAGAAFCVMAIGVATLGRTAPTDLDSTMPVRL